MPIPKDIPSEDILFTANRHVSNGWMPDITHLVYVNAKGYEELSTRSECCRGAAVGALTSPAQEAVHPDGSGALGQPRRRQLGVSVTYADISNTAMLVEIARQKGGYLPDLSFGTHFFQDLVESRIRYLPLYPDEENSSFNERFLQTAPNLLADLVPEFADLADVVKVIDVPSFSDGRILRVLMNADLEEAAAVLMEPDSSPQPRTATETKAGRLVPQYWRWRRAMAERSPRPSTPKPRAWSACTFSAASRTPPRAPAATSTCWCISGATRRNACSSRHGSRAGASASRR